MRTKWTNQFKKSRNYYPPRGGLLDNGQKARIAILAKEAFQKTPNAERPTSNLEFEEWRHEQQFLAVGKESLLDCVQGDYLKIVAHFEDLAGESGRAVKTHMADAVTPRAIAMLKLETACEERGIKIEYPAKICRVQYKCALEAASPNQLWQLVFTVRNRRKKLTADHADNTDLIPASSGKSESSAVDCPF
jgi:hypothetical protein